MKQMYVYILLCNDGSYYIGVTNNLEVRILQHSQGLTEDSYTKSRLPVILVYYESFMSPVQAIAREKQLKGWSRSKKEALIAGDEMGLKVMSECMNGTHYRNRK